MNVEDRNHWIRLFNRLDAAVTIHRRSNDGLVKDEADEALYDAHDKILSVAAKSYPDPICACTYSGRGFAVPSRPRCAVHDPPRE